VTIGYIKRLVPVVLLLVLRLNLSGIYAGQKHVLSKEWTAIIDSPVVVALSEAGEKRWGWYQFPSLGNLPDGNIICMFSHQQDAVSGYGQRPKCYVSGDKGKSWEKAEQYYDEILALPHGTISKVNEGEFLCMPAVRALDVRKDDPELPAPAAIITHKSLHLYRVSELPSTMRKYILELDGQRWHSDKKRWIAEKIHYDQSGALAWGLPSNKQNILIPRTWFEHPLLNLEKELLYADYRQFFTNADGKIPQNRVASLMVSTDNGHSFHKRATIALDQTGKVAMGEPCLSKTKDGRLACVMRRQVGNWKGMIQMAITFSNDRGYTWEPVESLNHLGVFPNLNLLDNGVLILSYGRPGVHLIFSLDGTGREWTEPITLRKGNPKKLLTKSCGYTSLLALGDNEFLVASSDFEHKNEDGLMYKAILVRRVYMERKH